MAHPTMYTEHDPYLAELRAICLSFPEAVEVEAWGRPTFRAGKRIFAVFNDTIHADGDVGVDTTDRATVPYSVVFKPDIEEHPALVADPRFYLPPYFHRGGWLGLRFTVAPVEWDEVGELMENSYRLMALKRMLRVLDDV